MTDKIREDCKAGKWTPGHWTVHKSRTTDDVGIMADNGCIAECFSEIRKRGEKAFTEQMANARLIAAAPDMLEALRHALYTMGQVDGENDCSKAIDAVEAAIAKAKGDAQ